MYEQIGRKLPAEAQYLSIKRQMGHKWCLLRQLFVFGTFQISLTQQYKEEVA